MKKFLIAAATLFIFCGQVEATSVDDLNTQVVERQEIGKWAHFRDKHILGRETENERRDRKEWERRHRYQPPPSHHHNRHYYDRHHHYPPPRYR